MDEEEPGLDLSLVGNAIDGDPDAMCGHEPTRDGDTEIHLLSNVPRRHASAQTLAASYRKRWTIETMFQELTETLTCEVRALGYPKAALFGFCLALLAYNAVAVLKAALRAVPGGEQVQQDISMYYLALEIAQTYDGMIRSGFLR